MAAKISRGDASWELVEIRKGGSEPLSDEMRRKDVVRRKVGRGRIIVVIAGLAVVALAALVFLRPKLMPDRVNGPSAADDPAERLELTRAALSATENLDTAAAEQAWSALFAQSPGQPAVALNRALNRLLHVDELTARARNVSLAAEEQRSARAQLPEAIAGARSAIEDYARVSGDQVVAMWLRSRIDLYELSLLPAPMQVDLRRELFDRLTRFLNEEIFVSDPSSPQAGQSIILAGLLSDVVEQLEDPLQGLPPSTLTKAAETFAAFSDQHPSNLFVALRAARLSIAAQDPAASELVRRTGELAHAIQPSLRRQTEPIGLTPDELILQITDAIEANDWTTARSRMMLWFNVLNSTELVKTDRRRAAPHPLDRLSFEPLRQIAAAVAANQRAAQGTTPVRFELLKISDAAATNFAAPVDFDLDLRPDIATLTSDATVQLWRNAGEWTGTEEPAFEAFAQLQLDNSPRGLIAADLFMVDSSDPQRIKAEARGASAEAAGFSAARHNTFPTVIVYGEKGIRLLAIDGREDASENRLRVIETDTGLEDVAEVNAMTVGDLEGDGDLDLIVATQGQGVRYFVNRGNRTFFEVSRREEAARFDADDPVAALAIVDLDRDLDLDAVTIHPASGRVGLIENLLHLQFRERYLDEVPRVEDASQIAVADVDGNVSWDLIVGGPNQTQLVFSQTADAGVWTVDEIASSGSGGRSSVAADVDNDSWQENLTLDRDAATITQLTMDGFGASQQLDVTLDSAVAAAADFDLDGRVDVLSLQDQQPVILHNRTQATGHFLQVRFKGIDDNNANSGRVNHYAIGSILELRFGPHYRSRVITSPMTHFGLDGFETAGSLRVIFPNGLTQTIANPPVDTLIEEEQTLKGSCPYLYAWDGEQFAFVTDCLWAAPLGLQVASGVLAKDRPWEYLKVDGRFVQPRSGQYELRLTEELWEVAYVDHVALRAVDHPADVEIWTNEKVGPPSIAEPTIYAFGSDQTKAIRHAADSQGRDVTEKLARVDQDFVQGFDRRLRQGLCPPHWIDLTLDSNHIAPASAPKQSVYLVLTGWILPTDTSLNIQIDQNPELPAVEFPSLWVPDTNENAGWRKAIPFMGFPGGKTKTVVVDITNVLNRDDPRVRIRTSAQIYWDCAQTVHQTDKPTIRTHDLELVSAEVAEHGFSARRKPSPTQPETYNYADATQSPRWPPLRGRLTRFGPCRPLLTQWDDQMAVISGGDEIRMTFRADAPPLPQGWKRDFVLHCVGWDKDADLNTLAGQSSGPLPYRSMPTYPPSQANMAESKSTFELNRHHLQRQQDFRAFWRRSP